MACAPGTLDRPSLTEVNLENMFVAIAKGGDSKADGRVMSQQAVEQWLTKAQVIDNKTITQSDIAAAFQKTGKTTIGFSDFAKMLADISSSKRIDLLATKEKLLKVPAPK